MNLADTTGHRPPAVRRGGQQSGHTWDFSDIARFYARPMLLSDGVRLFYEAVLESAVVECRHFARYGFTHEDARGPHEDVARQRYEELCHWVQGYGTPLVAFQTCCDVLGFDAAYLGPGMLRLAARLGAGDAYAPPPRRVRRRHTSHSRRVVEP